LPKQPKSGALGKSTCLKSTRTKGAWINSMSNWSPTLTNSSSTGRANQISTESKMQGGLSQRKTYRIRLMRRQGREITLRQLERAIRSDGGSDA
jgi:hypothetical protein